MAAIQKFNQFMASAWQGKHNLNVGVANLAGTSAYKYKVALSNTLPAATNVLFQDIVEIPATGGYVAGGFATTATLSYAAGVTKLLLSDVTITAVGGAIGPFQYIVVYLDQNDTNTLIATDKYLVGWIDYGSPLSLASSQGFIVDFDGTNGVFQYTS